MSFVKTVAAAVYFSALLFFIASCANPANDANKAANTQADATSETHGGAKTNLEELSLLISIPTDAENVLDIFFREDKANKKLRAVLRFAEEETTKLTTDLQKLGDASDVTIEPETWFPDELKSQSELRGETALKGKSYPANPFFLEPYSTGRITRIDGTEFFVLELTAR